MPGAFEPIRRDTRSSVPPHFIEVVHTPPPPPPPPLLLEKLAGIGSDCANMQVVVERSTSVVAAISPNDRRFEMPMVQLLLCELGRVTLSGDSNEPTAGEGRGFSTLEGYYTKGVARCGGGRSSSLQLATEPPVRYMHCSPKRVLLMVRAPKPPDQRRTGPVNVRNIVGPFNFLHMNVWLLSSFLAMNAVGCWDCHEGYVEQR